MRELPTRRLAPLVRPLQEFLSTETAGGALLLAAAAAALVWANVSWGDTYSDLWQARIRLDFNAVTLDETLGSWVNDGLMAIFFFVAGSRSSARCFVANSQRHEGRRCLSWPPPAE